MFCGCKNDPFTAPAPNTYTCPVCLGMPGTLPVPNKRAIESTLILGAALGAALAEHSKFDRKHYFYPDLPKSYQITQYDFPLCGQGVLETPLGKVRIRRIHLEEDTAKNLHRTDPSGKRRSLIDFNRAGVPLLELVTEPDIRSPEHAREFGKTLRSLVRYLGLSNADLERGEMRLEPSVSLTSDGTLPPYKVEIKNINSFGFLEKAIRYEMSRQKELLEAGTRPVQETRGWNETKNVTMPQRSKENAEDYRYFPDPDIPPLSLKEMIRDVRSALPELPGARIQRWTSAFRIEPRYAELLIETRDIADRYEHIFEALMKANVEPNLFARDVVNGRTVHTAESAPKEVVWAYVGAAPAKDIPEKDIESAALAAIAENAQAAVDFKSGKEAALNFLLGTTVRKLAAKTDTGRVRATLLRLLKN